MHMLQNWSKETDGNGATVRAILFDYKKAFDLIDHRILVEKMSRLNLPTRIINWNILISFVIVPKESNYLRAVTPSGV